MVPVSSFIYARNLPASWFLFQCFFVRLCFIFSGLIFDIPDPLQINYLDEWSTLSSDHENSLRGIIEALKASTLRLPVIGGAKMDIQEVKDAINSTVGVMQALTASICCLLSKVEEISCLASEIAKAAACERALLDQSKDLLSVVSAMHVKQCSVQACILQLAREASLIQLQ